MLICVDLNFPPKIRISKSLRKLITIPFYDILLSPRGEVKHTGGVWLFLTFNWRSSAQIRRRLSRSPRDMSFHVARKLLTFFPSDYKYFDKIHDLNEWSRKRHHCARSPWDTYNAIPRFAARWKRRLAGDSGIWKPRRSHTVEIKRNCGEIR